MPVRGPAAAILSFVSPKESIQRKGDPDAALILRSSLSTRVAERGFLPLRQRDASLHRPCGLIPSKAPVLGAAYGKNRRCVAELVSCRLLERTYYFGGVVPYFDPEHRSFLLDKSAGLPICKRSSRRARYIDVPSDLPEGGRQGCRSLAKGQEPLSPTPAKNEKRRSRAKSGCHFFWVLFFGQAKKSTSPVGARTALKNQWFR